jgi:hypothetical protein
MAWSEARRERDRYENRLKWERDLEQIKKDAYEEGFEIGMKMSGIVERIQFCQRLLKQTPTPTEQLGKMPLADLQRLADECEQRLVSEL